MIEFVTAAILTLVALAIFIRGLATRSGAIQFPFLFAAVMIGWFLPQAYLLIGRSATPPAGLSITMGYATLCLLAVLVADRTKVPSRGRKFENFDEQKLLIGAALMSAVGALAYYGILNTQASTTSEGLTTGIVTVYFFFYQLQYYGLALCLIVFLHSRSPVALALLIFNLSTISGFIFFGGRRGPLFEVVLIAMSALWFQWRYAPPRFVIILGLVAGALFVVSAGEYRRVVQSVNQDVEYGNVEARLPTIDEIAEIDFAEAFVNYDERRTDEVRNATYEISAATNSLNFDFLTRHWNYLVFKYVPAQFVGQDVKSALQFSEPDIAYQVYGYRRHIGTTDTGFSDSYRALFVFGALLFYFIARAMKWLWANGNRGDLKAQYFYSILIATALLSLTHSTRWFLVALPQALIFSLPVFFFAARRKKTKRTARVPG